MHAGPAAAHGFRASLLYAPDDRSTADFVEDFARTLACPADPSKRTQQSGSFYSLFRPLIAAPECAEQEACMRQPACWQHVVEGSDALLKGYNSEVRPLMMAALQCTDIFSQCQSVQSRRLAGSLHIDSISQMALRHSSKARTQR